MDCLITHKKWKFHPALVDEKITITVPREIIERPTTCNHVYSDVDSADVINYFSQQRSGVISFVIVYTTLASGSPLIVAIYEALCPL